MENKLTSEELDLILVSLEHTRTHRENTEYPSYEFRRSQIEPVEIVIRKVRALLDESK